MITSRRRTGLIAFALATAAAWLVPTSARAQSAARACAEAASEGQTLRDGGHLVDARAEFVKCAQPSCPKLIQKDCAAWQADVDERLPSIAVSAVDDAGNDVTALSLSVDGNPPVPIATGRSVPIDPGTHTLRVSSPRHRDASRNFVSHEGERASVVRVTLERLDKRALPSSPLPSPSPSPSPGDGTKPPPRTGSGPGPVPFVLLGAGLVGGVTFVLLFSGIKSDKDEVYGTPAYTDEKRSELGTRLVIADVIGIASAAALVGSAVLFVTSFQTANGAVSLDTRATRGGAAAVVRVRF